MQIVFSTSLADVQTEIDAKFPTFDDEKAVKSLLFSRFQAASQTPVRFLGFTGDSSMFDLLIDIPSVSAISEIDSDVLPFTCALP